MALAIAPVHAQSDTGAGVEWEKTFGGSEYEVGFSVQQTSDGGYIVAGWTYSFGAGDRDVYLIKTDSDGNLQWNKTFDEGQEGKFVQQTKDGGYIIARTNEFDIYVIKLSAGGSGSITSTTSSPTQTQASSSSSPTQTETLTKSPTTHTQQTTTESQTGFHSSPQSSSAGTASETSKGFSFNATCGPGLIVLLPLLPLLWRKRRR